MAEIHRRLIMISLDAVGEKDLPYLRTLPNFSRLWEQGAKCAHVKSVYPSLTYPAHTSIVTGKKPVNHGVINNTLLQPKRKKPDWMWQRRFIKGTTLYDEAHKLGWKTASLLWPVTAKSKITYNLPEVLANRPWQNQIMVSAANGSLFYELDLLKRFGHIRDGVKQPALDDFLHQCALYTMEKYHPQMMMIHYTDVDTMRHDYGVDHPHVKEALQRHDRRLGELLDQLERTGDMNKTTVVILGDHYQLQTERIVYLNYFLQKNGFLKVKNGVITDYTYIAKNCDGSVYIYRNPRKKPNKEEYVRLRNLLKKYKDDLTFGIEKIYTCKNARKIGADDKCVFLIEGRESVYFLDDVHTLTEPVSQAKGKKMWATHGYHPDKPGYDTFFLALGYGIREGVEIPSMHLYDEGPTLAKIMGVTLPDADGRCMDEMLDL